MFNIAIIVLQEIPTLAQFAKMVMKEVNAEQDV
jgi:hypothetical protein